MSVSQTVIRKAAVEAARTVAKDAAQERAAERAAARAPIKIKPVLPTGHMFRPGVTGSLYFLDFPADVERATAFEPEYFKLYSKELRLGDILIVREKRLRWIDEWIVTESEPQLQHVVVTPIPGRHVELKDVTEAHSVGAFRIENRGLEGWAILRSTDGATMATRCASRREAEYRITTEFAARAVA
jgi:hypothetical protein